MQDSAQGQVSRSAAEIYEEFFVPALFAEWAPRVADSARLGPGQKVLDVACGTGVLACEAARRVGSAGSVSGLDRNDGMLAVARRKSAEIAWCAGRAEALPFPDLTFDAVVSQFGLMFFEDRTQALSEMWRVLRPNGRLSLAVWDALERTPGYAAMTALLDRLFGARIASELRAPFVLGEPGVLLELLSAAGISKPEIQTHAGSARFPSIRAWVRTDIKGWTLADLIDDDALETLEREAERELARFAEADGSVRFESPALLVTACKR